MARSGLEELRSLYSVRNALTDETGPAWVDRVSELLHQESPTHAEVFDDLASMLFAGLSSHSVEPVWSRVGSVLRAAIADIKRGSGGVSREQEVVRADPGRVFVVHGRNAKLRKDLFAFLRAVGLQPLEWSQAVASTGKAAPYIGEVLDSAFRRAQAVVVLLTPDDEVRLSEALWGRDEREGERTFQMQARPNVLFEAGMAFGRHPDQTLLVQVGRVKEFSDVAGRHVLRLDNSAERRKAFADRLAVAGCSVDLSGDDWMSVGDFEQQMPTPGPDGDESLPGEAVRRGDLKISMGFLGTWREEQIVVENHGRGPASSITILADGRPIQEHDIWLSGQTLPTGLRPGEELGVKFALGMGSPQRADIRVTWTDDDGTERMVERAVQLM